MWLIPLELEIPLIYHRSVENSYLGESLENFSTHYELMVYSSLEKTREMAQIQYKKGCDCDRALFEFTIQHKSHRPRTAQVEQRWMRLIKIKNSICYLPDESWYEVVNTRNMKMLIIVLNSTVYDSVENTCSLSENLLLSDVKY